LPAIPLWQNNLPQFVMLLILLCACKYDVTHCVLDVSVGYCIVR
jgi:hypothetical protein